MRTIEYVQSIRIHATVYVFLNSSVSLFISGVGFLLVGEIGKVVHTGIERYGNSFALFKGVVALSAFNFGIIALVDSG